MKLIEELAENQLTLQAHDQGDVVRIVLTGKSNDRDPGAYLTPFFHRMLDVAAEGNQALELDFTQLSYMNSSTITPVVQLLERARDRDLTCALYYDRTRAWQRVSFTAMRIFASERIKIVATEQGLPT